MAIDAQRECSRADRPGTITKGERAQSAVGNRRQLVGVGVEQLTALLELDACIIEQGLKRTLEKSAAMVVLRKQKSAHRDSNSLVQSGSAISLILFGDQAEHATYPYCDRGLLAAI